MLSVLFDHQNDAHPTDEESLDDLPHQVVEIGTTKSMKIGHLASVDILQDSSISCGGKTCNEFHLHNSILHSI